MVDMLIHSDAPTSPQRDPQAPDLGLKIEAGFRRAVTQAIREAHEAGLRVPVRDKTGRFGWLDADGVMHTERSERPV